MIERETLASCRSAYHQAALPASTRLLDGQHLMVEGHRQVAAALLERISFLWNHCGVIAAKGVKEFGWPGDPSTKPAVIGGDHKGRP